MIDDIAELVSVRPTDLRRVRLVTVDGPAGAGKTSLAEKLAVAIPDTEVIHMDDLYEGWSGLDDNLPGRLDGWIATPLRNGLPPHHPVYDWAAGRFGRWRSMALPSVIVVEGVGAAHPVVAEIATVQVWVEAPPSVCRRRGLAREGHNAAAHWEAWTESQARYFDRVDPRGAANLIVDTARAPRITSRRV